MDVTDGAQHPLRDQFRCLLDRGCIPVGKVLLCRLTACLFRESQCFSFPFRLTSLWTMNEMMAIFAGVGLAAACGFRVFLPLFVASLAANTGMEVDFLGSFNLEAVLGEHHWLGSTPVTIMLGVATAVEVASYYVPWIDNALDTIATPLAVGAGTLITGTLLPEFMGDGSFKWATAMIAGGGTAGVVQGASVIARGTSSATTGGVGNPAVSTAELGGSVLTASLAVLVPVLAGLLVLVLLYFVFKIIFRYFSRRAEARREERQLARSGNRNAGPTPPPPPGGAG